MPKSKGADYAHMISEAQLDYSSDAVPLFDDFIGDSMQDFGPMLAAKGRSMFSWIADDSFEFEDDVSITPQAPFLSLNLDALAEQLAKAKLSERLYLQSDLLPLELLDEARGEDNQAPQTATSASSLSNDQAVNTDQLLQPQATNRSNSTSGKPSKFKETAAEAELDELLNSFSDTAVPREQRIPSSRDAVDILPEETSWIVSSNANTESVSSSKNPISKSGIVDDFDSWLDTI